MPQIFTDPSLPPDEQASRAAVALRNFLDTQTSYQLCRDIIVKAKSANKPEDGIMLELGLKEHEEKRDAYYTRFRELAQHLCPQDHVLGLGERLGGDGQIISYQIMNAERPSLEMHFQNLKSFRANFRPTEASEQEVG